MFSHRRAAVVAGLAGALVATVPLAVHAQKDLASCKVVFDASAKLLSTPNHSYITIDMGGVAPTKSESVSTGTVRYLFVEGKWTRSPITLQDEQDQMKTNIQNATAYTCHKVRGESVGGVAATLFSVHSVTAGGTTESQIWIANGTGLPVREESKFDTGGTVATTFDYTNVRAPAGVQ